MTLAELGEIAKADSREFAKADSAADRRDRRDSATTSALRGGGAVLAGAGLVGGGIPGAKPNPAHIKHWKEPGNRASASRASIGGIFGYRDAAHTKFSGESAAREAGYRAQTPDEHLGDADLYNRHR